MPLVEKDQIQLEVEHQEELEQYRRSMDREARREEHQLKLAKLKYATQPRYRSIERGIVAVTKAPACGIALICVTILTLQGREVPEIMKSFLTI